MEWSQPHHEQRPPRTLQRLPSERFGHTTATGLSKMTGEALSHDKVTRFLSENELDSPKLWRLVKPLVRQLEDEGSSGVLIIDDTIEEKPYTDESELICWHYDHSKGRNIK